MKNWKYIEGAKTGNICSGNKNPDWDVGNYDWDVGIFNGQWYITKNGQKFKGPFRSMNEAARYLDGHKWEFEYKLGKSKTGNDTPWKYAHRKPKVINDDKTGAEEFFKKLSDDVKEREEKDDADIEKVGNATPNYRYKDFLITNPEGHEYIVFLKDGRTVGYRGTTSKAQAEDWCDWHDPKTGKSIGNKVGNARYTTREDVISHLDTDLYDICKKVPAGSPSFAYVSELQKKGWDISTISKYTKEIGKIIDQYKVGSSKTGNAQWDRAYYKQMIDPEKWSEFEKKFEKLIYDQNLERYDMEDRMSLKPELRSDKYKMIERQRKDVEAMINKYRKAGNSKVKKTLFKSLATPTTWTPGINGRPISGAPEFKGTFAKDEAEKWTDKWIKDHGFEVENKTGNRVIEKESEMSQELKNLLKKANPEWKDKVSFAFSHGFDIDENDFINAIKKEVGSSKTGNALKYSNYSDAMAMWKQTDWSKTLAEKENGHSSPVREQIAIYKKDDAYYVMERQKAASMGMSNLEVFPIKRIGNSASDDKFAYVMREFDEGKLKTPDGKVVTDPAQAKAIAYSESKKTENGLARARKAMNKGITMWKGNDSAYIKEDGTVSYLENNSFETDKDKFESQESAIKELSKQGYVKK